MDKMLFSERVRHFRKKQGMSREELGELVGVSHHQVIKWENGRQGTSRSRMSDLYRVFGVTPDEFWGLDGGLFNQNGKTPTASVIGAGVPDVDENGRALVCPRCKRGGYSEHAIYCPNCAFPLYNLCSHEDRHPNIASARFCEVCGSKTFWGMDADELKANGVPPMR